MSSKKIVVDIDALLDMRLGVINSVLGYEEGFKITSSPEYYRRKTFDINTLSGDIDFKTYCEILKKKPKQIITNSLRTRMLEYVIEFAVQVVNKNIEIGKAIWVEICINLKHFKLSQEEEDQLILVIKKLTKANFDISINNYSDEALSPIWLKANASAIIKYDYVSWMNMHHQQFINNAPNSEFYVFVPRLLHTDVTDAKDKLENYDEYRKTVTTDLFETSRQMLSPALQIAYLPPALYSADTPANKNEYMSAKEIRIDK